MNMHHYLYYRRLILATTAFFAVFAASLPAHAAFDPTYGADSAMAIPDTEVLYPQKAHLRPTARAYISPLAPVQMPARPLYPSRASATSQTATVADAGPVNAAHYEPMAAATPSAVTTPVTPTPAVVAQPAFIAPAPVLAATATPTVHTTPEVVVDSAATTAPAPVAETKPVIAPVPAFVPPAPLMAAAPAEAKPVASAPAAAKTAVAQAVPSSPDALSPQTRSILAHIPSQLDTSKPKAQKLAMERTNPEVKEALVKDKDTKVETYNVSGLSIKVSRSGLDTGFELNRAYTMLMGGQTQEAVEVYKNIISSEPNNQDALFGLAATYHRLGELDKARPLYGALLKLNPTHREALNNFLVMVSDESPQEALAELERLEQRNPDFSPIPAQEAILMDKMGYTNDAHAKMLRAIELAPENLTYKYNLAIMLDRQGNYADAGALYRLLIDAALKGEKIPSSLESLQKRLNFITTAAAAAPASGV